MIRAEVDLGMNDFINFELSFDKINIQKLLKKSKVFYNKYGSVRIVLFDENGCFQGLLDVWDHPEPESERINILIWSYGIELYNLNYINTSIIS